MPLCRQPEWSMIILSTVLDIIRYRAHDWAEAVLTLGPLRPAEIELEHCPSFDGLSRPDWRSHDQRNKSDRLFIKKHL
jgi:hypothetical protein